MLAPSAAVSVNVQTALEIPDPSAGPDGSPALEGRDDPGGPEEFPGDPPCPEGPGDFGLQEGLRPGSCGSSGRWAACWSSPACGRAGMRKLDVSGPIRGGAEAMRPGLARRGNALAAGTEPGPSVFGVADFMTREEANPLADPDAHTENGTIPARGGLQGRELGVPVSGPGAVSGAGLGLVPRARPAGSGKGYAVCTRRFSW
jgi:hypothetical protein